MKIVQCHNYYATVGGEDFSVRDEARILREHGHEVVEFGASNTDIHGLRQVVQASRVVWNGKALRSLRALLLDVKPDVLHITNIFPLLSHSVYDSTLSLRIPIVQSVRNFRFACPIGIFHREGRICEECTPKTVKWPCVLHRCYRGNLAYSVAAAATISYGKWRDVWNRRVDAFVALTPIVRTKMIEAGLPADRIFMKPNLVQSNYGPIENLQDYAVYAGRLDPSKGVDTLLKAWEKVPRQLRLKIIGEGELEDRVREEAGRNSCVEWLGKKPHHEVMQIVQSAKMVIFPSEWYETFGRTILEAFACGIPVVASRLGAMEYLVKDGVNGRHFTPGDPDELATAVKSILDLNPEQYRELRNEARESYQQIGTPERNYEILMDIYRFALSRIAG